MGINLNILKLSKVRRKEDDFTKLSCRHISCYWGPKDRREHRVGFFVHKEIAGIGEELFGIDERIAAMIKLCMRCRLKIVQAYAPTASCEDEAVGSFYEDIESAIKEGTHFTVVMGD